VPLSSTQLPLAILQSGHLGLGVKGDPDGLAALMTAEMQGDASKQEFLRARIDGLYGTLGSRNGMTNLFRSPVASKSPSQLRSRFRFSGADPNSSDTTEAGDATAKRHRTNSLESVTTTAKVTGIAKTPQSSPGPPSRQPPAPPTSPQGSRDRRPSDASTLLPDNHLQAWLAPDFASDHQLQQHQRSQLASQAKPGTSAPANAKPRSANDDLKSRAAVIRQRRERGVASLDELKELERIEAKLGGELGSGHSYLDRLIPSSEETNLQEKPGRRRPSRADTWTKAIAAAKTGDSRPIRSV